MIGRIVRVACPALLLALAFAVTVFAIVSIFQR
jgi:hypothetical protein